MTLIFFALLAARIGVALTVIAGTIEMFATGIFCRVVPLAPGASYDHFGVWLRVDVKVWGRHFLTAVADVVVLVPALRVVGPEARVVVLLRRTSPFADRRRLVRASTRWPLSKRRGAHRRWAARGQVEEHLPSWVHDDFF